MAASAMTLLHISDLHFKERANSPVGHHLLALRQQFPWLDGLQGHDHHAAASVERLIIGLSRENPKLVVTGDLTQVGRDEQYHLVSRFLGEPPLPSGSTEVSLGIQKWKELAVPGNHDHWPGTFPLRPAANPVILGQFFPEPVYVRDPLPLGNGPYSVRLIGILSDTDTTWGQRFLARGAFATAIPKLDTKLGRRPPSELRVLLVHHSPAVPNKKTMCIEPNSLQSLHQAIAKHEISVVLTGHTHVSSHWHPGGGTNPFLEFCCGTTTQNLDPQGNLRRGIVGFAVRTKNQKLFNMPPQGYNTALVHRLSENAVGIYWETTTYMLRDGSLTQATRSFVERPGRIKMKVLPYPPVP